MLSLKSLLIKFMFLIGEKNPTQFPCYEAATIKYMVYANTKQDLIELFHWGQILKILYISFKRCIEYLLTNVSKNIFLLKKSMFRGMTSLMPSPGNTCICSVWRVHSFKMQK